MACRKSRGPFRAALLTAARGPGGLWVQGVALSAVAESTQLLLCMQSAVL